MLSNLSNNNAGNQTKNVVEKKHYEDIEKRLDELQDEIDSNTESIGQNAQDISALDDRLDAVEDNSTFESINTDTINPAIGSRVEITGGLDVGDVEANSIETDSLTVNGTNFTTVKDDAAQAKSIAENAKNKADEAYDLADALADELADYKADNEQSITTATLNADSADIDSIASQTINTNDFETTNAEIDDLYVDRIHATGELALPTTGQSYYTITIPAGTIASFAGSYITENDEIEYFYFTVTDGDVIYHQAALEVIKDISFDRETGSTKVRVKSTGAITYISSSMNVADPAIEDGGSAYEDFSFIPQKLGGQIIRGYNDTTTETFVAGVLSAYAITADEIHYERTVVDDLVVNTAIELPKEWNQSGNISRSSGTKGQYVSIQTKDGVDKPTWTDPVNNPIGSLSYSDKLIDEATMAAYKGISETRQTRTINVVDEASLNQLSAYLWTKNGDYWQPYEKTRVTIGDHTLWIDPAESNQGIRFYDGMVIADGTWDDSPVEEANTPPVNIVIYDAPTELSYPITNLGDKTTVHGEITATCFKGNVTGNADTATNATCFSGHTYECAKADILSGTANNATYFAGCTYADAKADILTGTANNATCFDGCTYAEAKANILSGCAAEANNATCFAGYTYNCAKADILSGCASEADNATCFNGCTYADAKADILSGCVADSNKFNGKIYSEACADILTGNAATATNTTCFDGKTYAEAKADILSGNAASATNATCFNGCTYSQAKADILSGNAASATNSTCFNGCTYSQAKANILTGTAKNATCFGGCTYSQAKADILSGTAAQAHCVDIDSLTTSSYPLVMESANCELGKSGTCSITFAPSTGVLSTNQVSTACIENSGTIQSCNFCATNDVNIDGNTYITGDLTVLGTTTTTHSEEVVTPSENILLRDTATTPVASGCYSGFIVKNYNGSNNDLEVGANSDGTLHVGVVGGTMEPVATRATEACMENDYVAHWDSTGIDLITKGASCTHDLCINGDATVTGALTANLTGNADTATNATCFDGCTYAEAKSDILTGTANNATCFNGCTYECAKADILSGNAASATNADNATLATCATQACKIDTTNANNDTNYTMPLVASNKLYTSNGKTLTYNPSSGLMKVDGIETAGYKTTIASPNNVEKYSLIKIESTNKELSVPLCVHVYNSDYIISHYDNCNCNIQVFGSGTYGLKGAAGPMCDDGNSYYWLKTCNYRSFILSSVCPVSVVCTVTTAPEGIEFITPSVLACANGTIANATCFAGRTYADAKADILSGCAADSAKLGNKDASCYINNSSTAQTKAGNLSIGAPAACTSTSAGGTGNILGSTGIDIYGSTSLPHIHFHNNKYCGEYSARIANTTGRVALTVNNGTGCTEATESKIFDFCSDGTFKGATNVCGTNIYQNGNKVIDSSSTNQTKVGSLCVGNPTGCTETSAGGNGIFISCCGCLGLYTSQPSLNFHYNKNCGSYSSRLIANAKGRLVAVVTDAEGCCAETTRATYCLCSDGTFSGACTICASTNIYSAGCPVVTTGNIATVAPGYNCTGTSNYVVTTKVCCAGKADCVAVTNQPMTYDSTTCCSTAEFTTFGTTISSIFSENSDGYPNMYGSVITAQAGRQACDRWGWQLFKGHVPSCHFEVRGWTRSSNFVASDWCQLIDSAGGQTINGDLTIPTACGSFCGNLCGSATNATCLDGYVASCYINNSSTLQCKAGRLFIGNPAACTSTEDGGTGVRNNITGGIDLYHATAPYLTFHYSKSCDNSAAIVNNNNEIQVCVTNATGCTAKTECTTYKFGSNGTFSGASTICASCNIYSAGCIFVGSDGGKYAGGSAELFAPSPFIDFHFNNYTGDYSARLINNAQGSAQLIVNNGCGTTASTQTNTYYFKSDGTFGGACTTITQCTCTACVNGFNATTNNYANLKFQATCCNATTRCNWNMCLCGSNGKLYNPQGFMVGSCPVALICDIPATPTCVACASMICSNTADVVAYNCEGCQFINVCCIRCSVAIGRDASADYLAVAVGCQAKASCESVAIGYSALAAKRSVAIGCNVKAGNENDTCVSTINIGNHVFNGSSAGIAVVSWRCDTKQCDLYNSLHCTFCGQEAIACNVAKKIGYIPTFINKCSDGEISGVSSTHGLSFYHCRLSTDCGVFYIAGNSRCYTINQGCTCSMPATTGFNSSTTVYIYY